MTEMLNEELDKYLKRERDKAMRSIITSLLSQLKETRVNGEIVYQTATASFTLSKKQTEALGRELAQMQE